MIGKYYRFVNTYSLPPFYIAKTSSYQVASRVEEMQSYFMISLFLGLVLSPLINCIVPGGRYNKPKFFDYLPFFLFFGIGVIINVHTMNTPLGSGLSSFGYMLGIILCGSGLVGTLGSFAMRMSDYKDGEPNADGENLNDDTESKK